MMVSGGGAFDRWSGHEDGALMNGISALKRDPLELPQPFPPWGDTARGQPTCEPKRNVNTWKLFWTLSLAWTAPFHMNYAALCSITSWALPFPETVPLAGFCGSGLPSTTENTLLLFSQQGWCNFWEGDLRLVWRATENDGTDHWAPINYLLA